MYFRWLFRERNSRTAYLMSSSRTGNRSGRASEIGRSLNDASSPGSAGRMTVAVSCVISTVVALAMMVALGWT